MTTESKLEPAREEVQAHIRKTVGISALRKIQGLVDEYEEEKRHARRMTPIGIALLCLAVVAVLLSLFVFRFTPAERPPGEFTGGKDVIADSGSRPLKLGGDDRTADPVIQEYAERVRIRIENTAAKQYAKVIRDKALYGSATLSTFVRADDGTVERIEVSKTSGLKELDDTARNIVMRASPFPAPPNELKNKTDVLLITREFRFTKD